MVALLAATITAQQEARKIVHRVYEGRELSLALHGETLRKTDSKTYVITGLDATMYTAPVSPENKDVQRIQITADGGTFVEAPFRLTLTGRVRLHTEDEDDLQTDTLLILREPSETDPLKVKHTLITDRPFVLTRPLMIVTGEGLTADPGFNDMKVQRNGRAEMIEKKPDEELKTILTTPGPMNVTKTAVKDAPPVMTMELPTDCDMERVITRPNQPPTTSRLSAARATFRATQVTGPTGKVVQITNVVASGHVQLRGAEGELTHCEELVWDRLTGTTDLKRGASQVMIRQKDNKIDADRARVDHATNTAVCEGNVVADLRREGQPEPTHVTAESLTIQGREGGRGESTAPEVTFDVGNLVIRSRRSAELERTNQLRILAPTIGFNPATAGSIIGGPKTIYLTPEGKPPTKITCEGIAIMDNETHLIQLEHAVRIVGADFTLEADRALITLSADGKAMERLRARGHVLIRQTAGQTIACDSVDYDGIKTMKVVGAPTASIRTAQTDLICERATIDTEKQGLVTDRTDVPVKIRIKRKP